MDFILMFKNVRRNSRFSMVFHLQETYFFVKLGNMRFAFLS